MYIILVLIILIVVSIISIFIFDIGQGFVNLSSLFIIISIVVPLLFASGLFRDFVNGIRIISSKNTKFSDKDINNSLIAVSLALKLILVSGLIGFFVGTIATLTTLESLSKIGPNVAMSLCTILYALFGVAFLMPVKAKLKSLLVK